MLKIIGCVSAEANDNALDSLRNADIADRAPGITADDGHWTMVSLKLINPGTGELTDKGVRWARQAQREYWGD